MQKIESVTVYCAGGCKPVCQPLPFCLVLRECPYHNYNRLELR